MKRPVVGIIANSHLINDEYPAQAVGEMNVEAVGEVTGALPLMVPSHPSATDIGTLMEVCDGFLFTGGRPNVHPEEYGHSATEAHGAFDRDRDRLVLPLIRSCVEAGLPILGICRGFQEFNVAFGGTLHPEIRDIPGRQNHRMPPDGTLDEKFELRHEINLISGGRFARVFGADKVMVNSLHGQGIEQAGERIVIEGHAPDGTPEAIYVDGAPGFSMAVQWHPEYRAGIDPVSKPLFEAFGDAVQHWSRKEAWAAQ